MSWIIKIEKDRVRIDLSNPLVGFAEAQTIADEILDQLQTLEPPAPPGGDEPPVLP